MNNNTTEGGIRSDLLSFYKNKTVLVTGHTGFKGTWLTRILLTSGARVIGYSLSAPTEPALYNMAGFEEYEASGQLVNITADIRDLNKLKEVFETYQPELVFHLAAQPIVRDSYKNPVYTYETNVMGTVNVLECIRLTESVQSAVIITTDKVYKNNEWIWGYREDEPLDGFDPYSNSKSCAELSVHSYRNSFFNDWDGSIDSATGEKKRYLAVSTARAGNVIGGGDFANDRIIPDCVRSLQSAVEKGESVATIGVRNPYSTRPYQHVLEPLAMYLTIAYRQWSDRNLSSYYNVGPDDEDCVTTGDLVSLFCEKWNDSIRSTSEINDSVVNDKAEQHSSSVLSTSSSSSDDKSISGNAADVAKAENRTDKKDSSQITTGAYSLPTVTWENHAEPNAPHEANFLKLDSTKIKVTLGYHPRWHISECMEKTVRFSRVYLTNPENIPTEMDKEIKEFFG